MAEDEALDVETAIRAYTTGAASALGVNDTAGSIVTGKQADVVHLAADPLAVDPARLSTVEIQGTWVAGRHVYERDAVIPS